MQQAMPGSVEALFGQLSQELRLLDFRGQSLVPRDAVAFYLPHGLKPGDSAQQSGYRFLRLHHENELYLCCAEREQSEDLLRLAAFGLEQALAARPLEDDPLSAWRRLLTETLRPGDLDQLLTAQRIAPALPRQVVVLELPRSQAPDAWELLQPLVPLDEGDVLLPLERDLVALVKPVEDKASAQDLKEFALALCDTVREETGQDLSCGIGDQAPTADQLRASCQQAREAMAMGAVFEPKQCVHSYHDLLLPRFLWEVPQEVAQRYHALLFNKRSASLFTQEMLQTIDMFLQKDLNLSDTARQLYIHRNTLVYRLDKVQRLSGLDLRRFDDAFIFKLLFELRKSRRPQAGDSRKAAT